MPWRNAVLTNHAAPVQLNLFSFTAFRAALTSLLATPTVRSQPSHSSQFQSLCSHMLVLAIPINPLSATLTKNRGVGGTRHSSLRPSSPLPFDPAPPSTYTHFSISLEDLCT